MDPDGIIHGFEVLALPYGRNVDKTIRQVQAFQKVRENNKSKATPSECRPSKQKLKPGPDLVDKVWEIWNVSEAFDEGC